MNNDSFPNPPIDPELEARIVDMVQDEASVVERERLQQLIEQDPALQAFKRQMMAVHELLHQAGQGESAEAQDQWKLSDAKREILLSAFENGESPKADDFITPSPNHSINSKHLALSPRRFAKLGSIAASIAAMVALVVVAYSLTLPYAKRTALNLSALAESDEQGLPGSLAEIADIGKADLYGSQERPRLIAGTELSYDVDAAPPMPKEVPASSVPASEEIFQEHSLPSPYYLEDDVQYIPKNGEFKLAEEAEELRAKKLKAENESTTFFDTETRGLQESDVPLEDDLNLSTVPEGGRVLLGGISKEASNSMGNQPNRLFRGGMAGGVGGGMVAGQADGERQAGVGQNGTILNITPRIVIQEEEPVVNYMLNAERSAVMPDADIEMHFSQNRTWEELSERPAQSDKRKGISEAKPQEAKKDGLPTTWRATDFTNGAVGEKLGTFALEPGQIRQEAMRPLATMGRAVTRGFKQVPADSVAIEEADAAVEPFSTFSLHVSDVSFKLAQAALARGEWPESNKIRIEEFVNAFDYGDPLPNDGQPVSCTLDQAIHPFLQRRNLLRVSMRTAATGRNAATPLRLTFLLDSSGSMERLDRRQTIQAAFTLLVQQLQPNDQVTLISFARQPRLLADKVPASESKRLLDLIQNVPSEGGTNIESALQLAFEKAIEQKSDDAQNRIVILTDGAVNLGDANPQRLSQLIESMRTAGIAFDAAGIGAEGLNDEVLEALTRKGDGRYYLLDSPLDANDNFAKQIAGALRPSAQNVKVQIEFNPRRVGRYKLLGFEKHRLNTEDFRNDQVDAAEMAAAEAGVAVYQYETKSDGDGDVGSVSVRFQDLTTGQMIEHRWPIPYEADTPVAEQSTTSMQIATAAALFAAKLNGEPLGEFVSLSRLSELLKSLPESESRQPRLQTLKTMIQQARNIVGE